MLRQDRWRLCCDRELGPAAAGTGTHLQAQPQQPHGALGRTLGLELGLVLHCGEEAVQPHFGDAVSWRKEQASCLTGRQPRLSARDPGPTPDLALTLAPAPPWRLLAASLAFLCPTHLVTRISGPRPQQKGRQRRWDRRFCSGLGGDLGTAGAG